MLLSLLLTSTPFIFVLINRSDDNFANGSANNYMNRREKGLFCRSTAIQPSICRHQPGVKCRVAQRTLMAKRSAEQARERQRERKTLAGGFPPSIWSHARKWERKAWEQRRGPFHFVWSYIWVTPYVGCCPFMLKRAHVVWDRIFWSGLI